MNVLENNKNQTVIDYPTDLDLSVQKKYCGDPVFLRQISSPHWDLSVQASLSMYGSF